jgi:uncharacterized protein YecE (DUF72 family)
VGKAAIHIGIGGWTYEPWRGTFYPKGLKHADELNFASRHVTGIEINGTYYRTQSRDSFKKWRETIPPGFVFSIKASRFCTNRRVLAEAGESIEKFLGQGLTLLGDALGPILWQFMPTKQFDPDDFGAFLKLLPPEQDGIRLRHAIEVRHESFKDQRFIDLAREHGAAIVFADSTDHPAIADLTADFVYARLQDAKETEENGYAPAALDGWADAVKAWQAGKAPAGLDYVADPKASASSPRDVFLFMINGAKVRAPAAAQALISRLKD